MGYNYENPTEQWPDSGPSQKPGPSPTEQMGGSGQFYSGAGSNYPGMVEFNTKTELLNTAPPTFAWLVIREGPRAGKIYHLNPDDTTLGRDVSSDIIIDDSAVSRQHAKIRLVKNEQGQTEFVLHDLATANGTKLNGAEILKETLTDGDRIEIGRTVLVFKKVD